MSRATGPSPPPIGRVYRRVLAFLLCFTALLVVVCFKFLYPALEAKQQALAALGRAGHPTTREIGGLRVLAAYSLLLLAVLLFALLVGLILTFRISRFFRPRPVGPRVVTRHVDAWAESAKRLDMDKFDDP